MKYRRIYDMLSRQRLNFHHCFNKNFFYFGSYNAITYQLTALFL